MSQQRQIAWSDRVHRDEIPGRLAPLAELPGKSPQRIFCSCRRRRPEQEKSAGGCSKCCRRGRPASRTGAVSPLTQSHAPPRWDRPAVPAVWGCRGSGSWGTDPAPRAPDRSGRDVPTLDPADSLASTGGGRRFERPSCDRPPHEVSALPCRDRLRRRRTPYVRAGDSGDGHSDPIHAGFASGRGRATALGARATVVASTRKSQNPRPDIPGGGSRSGSGDRI